MKKQLIKWGLRLLIAGLSFVLVLAAIVLNPTLLYSHETIFGNYTIYHDSLLDNNIKIWIEKSATHMESSEIYDSDLKIDICLNDGSSYPKVIWKIFGSPVFGTGFYNKVVLHGEANYKGNYVRLNGYQWNLTQLLIHEQMHCMQFNYFGLLNSNPIADYPHWKWEGYPEYISRQNIDQKNLLKNITHLIETAAADKNGWGIGFADKTFTSRTYYNWWTMVHYCLEIKKMS